MPYTPIVDKDGVEGAFARLRQALGVDEDNAEWKPHRNHGFEAQHWETRETPGGPRDCVALDLSPRTGGGTLMP